MEKNSTFFHLHEWKNVPASRLFGPPCLLGVKVGLYTLCIFACAKLNIILKMCEMFQWKKDLRIPTTDINQECLLFSVKRYGSHYCRKNVAEKKWVVGGPLENIFERPFLRSPRSKAGYIIIWNCSHVTNLSLIVKSKSHQNSKATEKEVKSRNSNFLA